jgi:hypothetical protein
MAKTIHLKFEGKDYELEYNRDAVRVLESTGFVADDLFTKPVTMLPMLFYGAFMAHHKGIKRKEVERIYENLSGRSDLIGVLIEMYRDTVSSLMVDDNDGAEGNATWTMSE